ncbi:DUF3306 domain-containing protein [uncultured Tateyamaria sp.]|uniref:DUF3306 domain-containing protein n=1 Tax=uncultured Tateyamaria sp. TaxID=455651 RepID=UPI002639BFC3|nr:DUF3306 domain-containing protein [uncultured Tateyamaria sp.]
MAEAEVAKLEERPDEELLAELNLPEPEALDSPDEVRDFLKAELPQRLKTRALRRLWRLNPMLANLDGLVDYGEDYTDAAILETVEITKGPCAGGFDTCHRITGPHEPVGEA